MAEIRAADPEALQAMRKPTSQPAPKKKDDTETAPKDTKTKEKLTKAPPKDQHKPETNTPKEPKAVAISTGDSSSEESEE